MTHRAVPTALSFGQQFLFQEAGTKPQNLSRLNKKRVRPKQFALALNLKRIALVGWVLGFVTAILIHCFWPSILPQARNSGDTARLEIPADSALVTVASRR